MEKPKYLKIGTKPEDFPTLTYAEIKYNEGLQKMEEYYQWYIKEYCVKKEDCEELLELVEDFVCQGCSMDKEGRVFDSMALSTYAYALRLLARFGKVKIIREYGDRVIAKRMGEENNGEVK